MPIDQVSQPDMLNRLAVGRLARELFTSYLEQGKHERAMGLVQFCDKLGVTIPDAGPMLKLVRQGRY